MKKSILLLALACISIVLLSAQTNSNSAKQQYLIVFRFKSNFLPPSQDVLQVNIKHWQEYMGSLAKAGNLVSGFRPVNEGKTITGSGKTIKEGSYIANNELISSVIIINASSIEEATEIANKCPIFEFGGSAEVRQLIGTAN
ncbi:MAG TPA: YciI family protein [Puia sp.]|nr:YciI family protein [Puia sp.]